MTDPTVHCSACGTAGRGNFCSACGAPLGGPRNCSGCGSKLSTGAMYCAECGVPVAARAPKPASARLPWVLSAVALAAFALVLSSLVQRGSVQRIGDMTVTGGLPTSGGNAAGGAAAPAGGAAMPSMEELASMSPRDAADRLFERAMRELEGGDFERSAFFLDMGLKAYEVVPAEEIDADAKFHMGLMQLHLGDSTAARASGEGILAEDPDHLLGLILSARVAELAGDEEVASEYRARVRSVIEREGGIPSRQEYQSHRPLIERELEADS